MGMEMTPIERAARALYLRNPQTMDVFTRDCADPKSMPKRRVDAIPWQDLHDVDKAPFAASARAVLEAIREPSDEMIGSGAAKVCSETEAEAVWEQMIDAALKEG